MTDDATGERGQAERALADHGAFARDDGGFSTTTTAVDARVEVAGAGAGVVYRVTVRVPTIDAVVAGETVAPVVQEGWFETFERRLEDVGGVTRGEPTEPVVSLEGGEEVVVVETTLDAGAPREAAADAKAVVDYVEGTFVEGLIPGYAYREPASSLLERARAATEQSVEE